MLDKPVITQITHCQRYQKCHCLHWIHIRSIIGVFFVAATFGDIMTASVANFNEQIQLKLQLQQQHSKQQQQQQHHQHTITEIDVLVNAFFMNNSLFMEINSSAELFGNNYNESGVFVNESIHDEYNNNNNNNNNNNKTDSVANSAAILMLVKVVVLVLVLGLMILITIVGNVIVIAAIILERNLQNVANYLVVSLAVADLFVAGLVMPLGAVYEINDGWILGAELCDIWTSCDVLCCTASILHLVAIAADRYWTVTNIDYNNVRTPARVFTMIFLVWLTSLVISLAPQFGWKDPEYMLRIEQKNCMVSQDVSYQIFATCCTFYVPLLVILFLYWKIYKIARKRIQRRAQRSLHTIDCKNLTDGSSRRRRQQLKICFGKRTNTEMLATANSDATTVKFAHLVVTHEETDLSTSNFDNKSHAGTELTTISSDAEDQRTPNTADILTLSHQVATTTTTAANLNPAQSPVPPGKHHQPLSILANPHQKLAKRRQMLEAKRERKAAQTLAIITGAFVVCWLPFFVMALLLPLCKTCQINPKIASFILWLGYFNSTLNPIIYTIFNPEFRRAFQRILCGRKHTVGRCRSTKI